MGQSSRSRSILQNTKQLHQPRLPSTLRMKCLLIILAIASATSLAKACDFGGDCIGCQTTVQNIWDGLKEVGPQKFVEVSHVACEQVPWKEACHAIADQLTPLWTSEIP